jgi:hypothetical protein
MEIAKIETEALELVTAKQNELQILELADLELTMIGGGCGDIHLA